MAPAAATQLPNLWDDAHAASLDEPGLLLYRSNLLGGDLRIANFGGERAPSPSPEDRRKAACRLLPAIRSRIASTKRKVGHFTDAPEALQFVNSRDLENLAALGASCPDHFLRAKIRPLIAPEDAAEPVCFLASDLASKSTGDIVNVDAGNAVSFAR
jgi:rhamnose utilization protein RhaD (predicted bifunctional aldolase and dehydrogenase)